MHKACIFTLVSLYTLASPVLLKGMEETEKGDKAFAKGSFATVSSLMFDQVKNQNPQAFDILLACAFLAPENIPVSWVVDLLEHEHLAPEEAHIKANEVVVLLNGYNLICFDGQREVFSLNEVLHQNLQEYHSSQKEQWCSKILSLLERQGSKFDEHKVATWHDTKVWSKHAEFFLVQQEANLKDYQTYADIASVLGKLYEHLGNPTKALHHHRKALQMRKKLHEEAHSSVVASLDNIGLSLNLQGEFEQALDYFRQAMQMKEKLYGKEAHTDMADSLNNIGATLFSIDGKHEQALGSFRRAMQMHKKVNGEGACLGVATSLRNIGLVYNLQGNYEEAHKYHRQALKMYKELYGEEAHPLVATSLLNIGFSFNGQRKYEETLDYYGQALKMYKKVFGEEAHHLVASTLNNIGVTLLLQRKHKEALDYCGQALKMYKKLYGDERHHLVANCLNNIGFALYSQGKREEAVKHYEQALGIQRELYASSPNVATQETMRNIERNLARANTRCILQ